MYTSKELSKKIAETGFKRESEMYWYEGKMPNVGKVAFILNGECGDKKIAPAYDIIYDICIKYPKEFFGEDRDFIDGEPTTFGHTYCSHNIFKLIKQGKPLKEIEDYIEKNSILFNK